MSVEPKLFPKVFLPPPLQDLLVREAVFGLSRNKIGDALTAAREDLAAIVAAKPRLSFVRQDAKKDHRMKVLEAEESVALLESAVQTLDASIPALHACVGRSVENYLREMDPEYVTGLSAGRFADDWQGFLTRYEAAVDRYLSVLSKLPAQLEQIMPNEVCGAHFDGRQLIEETVRRATEVQDEIAFLNKIADAQRLRGRGQSPSLQRQPERSWRKMAQSMFTLRPLDAVKVVKTMKIEAGDVLERSFAAIKEECRLATYSGGYGVTSYHHRVWIGLREAALLKILPEQFEQIVSETEIMLETGRLEEWVPERVESVDPLTAPVPAAAVFPTRGSVRVTVAPTLSAAAVPVAVPPAPVVLPPDPMLDPYAGEPGLSARPPADRLPLDPYAAEPALPPPLKRGFGVPGIRMPFRPSVPAPAPVSESIPSRELEPIEESKPLVLKRAGRSSSGTSPMAVEPAIRPGPAVVSAAAAAAAAALPVSPTSPTMTAKEAAALVDVKAERERLEMLLNETKASLNEREEFLSQSEARLMQTSQAQLEREVELEQREEQLRELEKRFREMQAGGLGVETPPPPAEKKPIDEFNE